MKFLIKISFILLLFSKLSPLFAQEFFTQNYENDNLDIKVGEKKVVFYNIIGSDRDLYKTNINIKLPEGFKLLTNTSFLDSLKIGELRKLFFTITVDPSTPFGKYSIEMQLLEKGGILTNYTLYFNLAKNRKIEILPLEKPDKLSQKAQEEIRFLVKNVGNAPELVRLSSRSGRVVGNQKINLQAGESQIISTVNDLPVSNQSIRLISFDLICQLDEVEKPFVALFTVPIMSFATSKSDPYQRFPIQASLVYNKFRSGSENIGAMFFDITGKGFVDNKNKHLVEFIARGPNRFSMPRFGSIDQYFLGYQNDKLKVELGDKMFVVSNLVENSRFAKGMNLKRTFGKNEASIFYFKPRFIKTIHDEFGSIYTHHFSENFKTSAIYMHKYHEENKQNLGSDFLSIYGEFAKSRYQAKSEISLSKTANLVSSGVFYNSSLDLQKFKMYSNVIFTGKNYFGFYNNSLQINNSAIYYINKKTSVGYAKNISQINPSLDSFYYTVSPYVDNNSFNFNFDVNKRNRFKFYLISGMREDKMEVKTYHYKEQLFRYLYEKTSGKLNFKIDGDFGKSLNLLEVKDLQKYNDVRRMRGYIGLNTHKNYNVSLFLENLKTTKYTAVNNSRNFWFYGVNAQIVLKNSLYFNLNYRNNYAPDELYQSQSYLDASINLRLKNQEFSMTGSYGYIPPPINDKNTFFTLKYTININTPIRKKKGLGAVTGKLEGTKSAGVVLNLNGKNVLTDVNGNFAFNDLVPGKYYLGANKSTLGFGNILEADMPYLIEILPNEKKNIKLEVINTGKIIGDISLNNTEEQDLENIVVEVYNDGFSKVTTTNKNGGFQFSELREGEYKVRIISENIKKQYFIKNAEIELKVKKGTETLYTFEMEQKKKKINFQKERIILSDI